MSMAEKKNPGRFTIQFNPADPKQQSVSDMLEQQGRHKAQFITNAVLHYIHCPETPEIPEPQPIDKDRLEKLVLDILSRQRKEAQTTYHQETPAEERAPELIPEVPTELEKLFGKEGISAIASTLSAFQRG